MFCSWFCVHLGVSLLRKFDYLCVATLLFMLLSYVFLVLLLPGQLRFGLWRWFTFCALHGLPSFLTSWRCLLRIHILYEHWKSRTDCSFLCIHFGVCYWAVVACTFLFLQSYRTLAEWEFGWGGTSVIMQHRCPKGSSVRTETSLRV